MVSTDFLVAWIKQWEKTCIAHHRSLGWIMVMMGVISLSSALWLDAQPAQKLNYLDTLCCLLFPAVLLSLSFFVHREWKKIGG
jgi:hypothetical protein